MLTDMRQRLNRRTEDRDAGSVRWPGGGAAGAVAYLLLRAFVMKLFGLWMGTGGWALARRLSRRPDRTRVQKAMRPGWVGCLVLSLWAAVSATAATYYIDFAGGSDSNPGTSMAAPWKRHPYMKGFTGSYSHQAGDRFIFKGGVVWTGCWPLTVNVGGSASAYDYYGVTNTWYAGTSWTRPVFDGGGGSTTLMTIGTINYLYVDGIEFRNMVDCNSIFATAPNYTTLSNLYIHNWRRVNDTSDGVIGGIYNNYGGASIGRRTIVEFLITHCVIDNSDGDASSGVCVRGAGELAYSLLASAPELQLHGGYSIHDCTFSNATMSFLGDAAQHPNATYIDSFNGIEKFNGKDIYFYNNLFINIRGGGAVQLIYPNFGSGGFASGPANFWCFNNVVVNCPNSRTVPIEMEFVRPELECRYYFFNNTFENTQSGGGIISVVYRSGMTPPSRIEMFNNHFIGPAAVYVPSGTLTTVAGYNLTNSVAAANAAGYTASGFYAPPNSFAATVLAGTNLTAVGIAALNKDTSRGNARPPVPRPSGGAWDIGAYFRGGISSEPTIGVSPYSLNFSSTQVGTSKDLVVTVRNEGGGTLSGSASVAAPFQIVSGGSYSLGSNQAQTVTVRYAPTVAGNDSRSITFTGGGGATVVVSGSAWAVLPGNTFDAYAGTITAPFVTNAGGYISQSQNTGVANGGSAVYAFNITNTGSYVISATVNAPSDAANSLYVNLDAEPTDPAMIWDIPVTSGFEERTVSWRGNGTVDLNQYIPAVFNLTAGTHQLIVRGREANVQLRRLTVLPYAAWRPAPPVVGAITHSVPDVNPAVTGFQTYAGTTAQLAGTALEPNGYALSWQWICSINGGSETVWRSGTGAVATVSYTYPGNLAGSTMVWELRVSNGSVSAESQLAVEVVPAPVPADGLAFEAESGVLSSPFIAVDGAVLQTVETLSPAAGGRASYRFTLANAGSYVIQAWVSAESAAADSLYVNIDGEPLDPTMIWDIPLTTGFEERTVSWRGGGTFDKNEFVPKVFNLAAGQHELIVRGREANVRIDRWAIVRLPSPPMNFRVAGAQ